MDKKKILVGVLVGVVILTGIIAIAGLMYSRATRTIDDQYIPRTLLVNLTKPLNGSNAEVGETILVSAEADGLNPIQSLEFWVDGVLVETTNTLNPELKQLNGLWNWIPDKVGRFTLVARGKDIHGQTIMSNPAVITVGPAEPVTVKILPKTGDTLTDLAQKFNVDAGGAAEQNPNIDPSAPLKGGEPVELALPAGNFPKIGNSGGPLTNPEPEEPSQPNPQPTMNPGEDKSKLPLPPHVNHKIVDGCNIQITISAGSDNTDELNLYMIKPGEDKNTMVYGYGPLGKGEIFDYVEKNTYGTYQIYVEAVNPAGVTSSDPRTIIVADGACAQYAKAAADVKVITRRSMSKLFCYVTIDKMTYIHVPITSDSYVYSMSKTSLEAWAKNALPNAQLMARSGFDLTSHLPVIYPKGSGTSHIKFECWDWDGQINLGTVEDDFTDDELKTIIILSNEQYDVVGVFGAYAYNANSVMINTPYNFKSTGNPTECGKHGPSYEYPTCLSYIKIGMAAFVWDFTVGKCFPGSEAWCHFTDIDGFRIYRQYKTGEPPQWTFGVAGKEKVTAGFTPWPSPPDCNFSTVWLQVTCLATNMPCYTVRAYKGSIESHDSNVVCLGSQEQTTGIKTINIPPTLHGVGGEAYFLNKDASSKYATNVDYSIGISKDGSLSVGHRYHNYEGFSYGNIGVWDPEIDSRDYFGFIKFASLGEIMGKPIQSAALKFQMVKTTHTLDGWINNWDACARRLYISNEAPYFYLKSGPPKMSKLADLPLVFTPNEIRVDVTDIVKGWSQNQKNDGFVLDGRSGPMVMEHDEICLTDYNSFQLEVTYFPNP